jgi:hypothetical protein
MVIASIGVWQQFSFDVTDDMSYAKNLHAVRRCDQDERAITQVVAIDIHAATHLVLGWPDSAHNLFICNARRQSRKRGKSGAGRSARRGLRERAGGKNNRAGQNEAVRCFCFHGRDDRLMTQAERPPKGQVNSERERCMTRRNGALQCLVRCNYGFFGHRASSQARASASVVKMLLSRPRLAATVTPNFLG